MPTTTGKATDLITFSRGSLATVTDADGRIKWAPHNLLLASEQFDRSNWLKTHSGSVTPVITANAGVAPDGTMTADRVDYGAIDAAGDTSVVYQTFTSDLATYGIGVYVKAFAAGDVGKKVWIYCYDTAYRGVASVTLTSSWQLLSSSASLINGNNREFYVSTLGSTNGGENQGAVSVLLWGAHLYRSDLGGMQANASAYPMYNPSTPRNLFGWSEAFDNAAWTKTDATIPATKYSAVNGSTSANLMTASAGTGIVPRVVQTFTSVSGTTYTASYYVKPNTHNFVQIYLAAQFNNFCTYTLTGSGSVSATGAAASTGAISAVGDGWYRLTFTYTASGTDRRPTLMLAASGTAAYSESWNPAGTESVYLYGAMLSDSASLDPYVGSYGPAPSAAAAHGPRLDYDSNGSARGLLVEEARSNLVLQSAAFDSASWDKIAVGTASAPVVTANNAISPDGTQTADLVVFDRGAGTSGDRSVLSQSPSTSAGTYTQSVWLKAATAGDIGKEVALRNVAGGAYLVVTLTASWVRYTRTEVWASNNWEICNRQGITADVTVSVHVWGAQLEAGSFATSYIPTAAATVTRNADVASVATSQFPYSASASSLVVSAQMMSVSTSGGFRSVILLSNETSSNRIGLYNQQLSTELRQLVVSGGSPQSNVALGSVASNTTFKVGTAVSANDTNAALNGSLGTPDPTVTMPAAATMLTIGTYASNQEALNGWIRQITYLPRRISDSELQARTV